MESDNLTARLAILSPAKRALLELRLKEKTLDSSVTPNIPRRSTRDSAPLSFAQQRLWFLNQLEPESPAYNESNAVRLSGILDLDAFKMALNQIVTRHEILRSIIVTIDGSPRQVVTNDRDVELRVIDLQDVPETDRDSEVQRLIVEAIRRPFDLSRDLMLRALLLRLAGEEHIFLVVKHHIASDGWSSGIFWLELTALYRAFASGEPSSLPELPIQYADYAVWQREWLQGEILERQSSYWKKQLNGLGALELPTDRPRPAVRSYRGARQSLVLPKDLLEKLNALSLREGVTPFMTSLAAFQTLLYRYTGQEDIAVGCPIAGRARQELEGLIGFFVNTLVMRINFSGSPTFRELLARVREAALGAYAHQDLPFEKLVEELQPERSLSHSPLFQVAFAYHNTPRHGLKIPGVLVSPVEKNAETTKFDLHLSVDSANEEIRATLSYATDLYDDGTITCLLGHYRVLLEGIIADPDQRLSDLPLLTEVEKHQLLVEWNHTKRDYPKNECLHQWFQKRVENNPDTVAVIFEKQQLTYRELNTRANQLAHYLQKLGIGAEKPVGIFVERSLEMVIALLGVLKAGGAYVPLDPSYPKERLAFMLEDAQVGVLLTQQRLIENLPEHHARLVCLDQDREEIEQQSGESPDSDATPGNLAYVIYTSGSTGKPKGVAVEHRQLANYLFSIIDRLDLTAQNSFATVSTISADLGNTVIFSSLCTGGSLHVISQDRIADAEALAEYFGRNPIDCLKMVPSHLTALQTVSHPERVLPRRLLILGGEAWHLEWIRSLGALALPGCNIVNHYGPTETTIGVMTYTLEQNSLPVGLSTVPLGRPLSNTQIYLLDRNLNAVPVGVAGELHVGGLNVTRGYLNYPDLTAERFIPDPFSTEPGARLYKTGDLARYLADGNVEFLGRTDQQVKIRGYRIEPGEVECVLSQHADIRQTLITVREDDLADKRLTAYVVPSFHRTPTIGGKPRYRLPNGAAIAQLNKNETDYIYQEIFERQAYLRHGITINDGDCIFDVGANIGLFMLFSHQVAKRPKVYSFEPNPAVFEILSANSFLYGSDVRLFNYGLSNEEKKATFTFFPGFSLLSGFYADAQAEKAVVKAYLLNQQKAGVCEMAELVEQADAILDQRFKPESFSTELKTLSCVIKQEGIESIDLLKINVEKSELDVLKGIEDQDWHRIKQIVVEVDLTEHLPIITSLLEKQGYEIALKQDLLLESTPLCYVYAVRPLTGRRLLREQHNGAHIRSLPVLNEPLISARELRSFLAQKVPEHMLPSAFVFLDSFPLTPNGKIAHKALPVPDHSGSLLEQTHVAPRTPIEELLANIWAEVLKVQKVGVHDDFFDLGGHSLLAIQVMSRVRETLPLELSLRVLFEAPSIAELALRIEQSLSKSSELEELARRLTEVESLSEREIAGGLASEDTRDHRIESPLLVQDGNTSMKGSHSANRVGDDVSCGKCAPLERRPQGKDVESLLKQTIPHRATGESAPLSFAQERLWFFDQYEPNSSVYNVPNGLRLRGQLNFLALEQTLNEMIRRHEVLRTTFSMVGGEPVQVIMPSVNHSLPVVDLRDRPENEREREARRLASEEARRPFDLVRGPLFRTTLIRLGEENHVLLLTLHHIVADGWSMGVLYRELSLLYQGFSQGRPSALSELPIQYVDYAVWQRKWLQHEALQSQLSYWKKQLEGAPGVLNIPTDRARPTVQTFHGNRETIELSKELSEGLKALNRKQGVTLFMTLLAAFQTLLYRYTGQEDTVVGTPIANRTRREIEELIGCFVNTLVIRSDLSGNPRFKEMLARVRETALAAYTHQDLPFEKLVEELQPQRSLSHSPLFQVMFVLQNAPNTAPRLEGLHVSPVSLGGEAAKFDLTLSMHETAEGLRGSLQYNTALFDQPMIARMVNHFQTLLEGIVADPDQRISAIPILTEREKHQLFVEWNDTKREYPSDKCIHQLFENQVEKSPEAIAAVFEDEKVTYRELNCRANQLAHYLQKLGVGPESLVGICMERSLEMIVGLLGILKAGGAYVPLDPEYPQERLSFMLADAPARVVLTQQRLMKQLPNSIVRYIAIDTHWQEIGKETDRNPVSCIATDNLAYVIYTSGSTGKPKGVAIAHRSAAALLLWAQTVFTREDMAGVLASTSICFDLSVFEFFSPLSCGGRVVLAHDALCLRSTNCAITLINTVPSAITELLAINAIPPSVRTINLAGESLKSSLVKDLYERTSTRRVFDLYGPSEDTTYSTFALRTVHGPQTIGRPIANTTVYVLDEHLQPVPIGVPGQLHIAGDGLARGYLKGPDLTAEKFIPDPFGKEPGSRLYRTGDVARYLPNGDVEFLGRIDHQVKLRGFRIELGEIEAVLGEHCKVREAVVLAREDAPGDKRLVAYVVPSQSAAVQTNELRDFLKGKLPDYMVPSAFVLLDAMPLTRNGKLDRKGLPVPANNRIDCENSYAAPRTSVEGLVARIWAEVLNLEKVGIYESFFDLGGHSLLGTQLMSRVRDALQVDLPLRVLFEASTIAELSLIIERRLSESNELEEVACHLAGVQSLSEEEMQRGGDKEMNGIRGATIYQIVQTWAEKTPEATAIVLPGQAPITYRQLLDQIESIIASLSESGVGPGDRIAIVLPNGIEMIAAFLGVSCVAISAPLNPSYTENEFDFYLSDLAAKAVIAQSSLDSAAVFVARRRGIPVIEAFSAATQNSCGFTPKGPTPALSGPHRPSRDDDVALVLHTSGTTATPKRVPLTHKNLCSSAFFVRDTLNLKSSDRCLNLMPLFHIHGLIGGLLSTLAAGASFAAPPKFDGDCFFDWLDELKPTWYTAVPAIHQAILRCAQGRAESVGESQLRFIRSSSAPLSPKVMTELEELFKVPVIEAYGMTEASHQITSNPLPPFERKKGSVGVATTTDVAIMDEEGQFLAAGKIGEIVIRGANVTSGDESEEGNQGAFTDGWFRTGDLGYFDADGYLFLTGRLKEIINRGGETIATREIDDALLEHPDILQAAAFAIPHPTLGETVAAAVVLRDNSRVTEAEIRQHLVERLADSKTPARLLFVDDLPRTSTGKIRRANLCERVVNEPSTDFAAPKNELELLVAGIYADVLGIQQISAGDNFFALGGDSLRATQVISRVRSLFSVNLSIGTLFTKPTVAELAEEIIASAEALDEASKAAILLELKEPSQADRD